MLSPDPIQLMLAMAADAVVGDPPGWPHLVRIMGAVISFLERRLRSCFVTPRGLRLAGAFLAILVTGGFGMAAWGLIAALEAFWHPLAWLCGLVLAWQCLAAGQLWREAKRAAKPLEEGDLPAARARLAMIVGRDTSRLDQAGVRRAIIETVAENLSDAVVAPLFYLALLGPAGAVAYKAINTLDSMVGYKNQAYRDLGLASARVDDLANWIPARLSALVMLLAAPLLGLDARFARRVLARDHAAHKSPNAGWPEATCAGALGIRLGGPNFYHGRLVEKPWLNAQGRDPQPGDLDAALRLMALGSALSGALAVLWSLAWA